jgi:hypothetical protein
MTVKISFDFYKKKKKFKTCTWTGVSYVFKPIIYWHVMLYRADES